MAEIHKPPNVNDGRGSDNAYKPGDIKQLTFKEGELMIRDVENVGDTELLFTTVEFLDSPNAPLELRSQRRSTAEV
jgi:beta-alanine degradation protein BauB